MGCRLKRISSSRIASNMTTWLQESICSRRVCKSCSASAASPHSQFESRPSTTRNVVRMLPAGHVSAYAGNPDDLRKMEQCMKAIHDLGRLMVALVKMNFRFPAEFMARPIAYGTHTK